MRVCDAASLSLLVLTSSRLYPCVGSPPPPPYDPPACRSPDFTWDGLALFEASRAGDAMGVSLALASGVAPDAQLGDFTFSFAALAEGESEEEGTSEEDVYVGGGRGGGGDE